MENFEDMTPITKKSMNDFYTVVDTHKIKTRLDNKKGMLYEVHPTITNPLNESQELLRHYTSEMEDLKNAFEGEQSSITLQKNKVKQILKQVRALKEKVPESHLPKSGDSIFGGYLIKWLDMLYPNGENNEINKTTTNTERSTYVSMGIKRLIERCEKLKGQLFDSEEKSKMKTSIIQELSTNNSLLQSQLEMEKKNEEKINKIFQLEDQNLELKKHYHENSERYEQMLNENTLNRKKMREMKEKMKEISDELNVANEKNKEFSEKFQQFQESNHSLKQQVKSANERIEQLEKILEQSKIKVSTLEQDNVEFENKVNQLNQQFQDIIQNKDNQISEVELKSNLVSNKLKSLKEKVNSLQLELQNEKQNNFEAQRKLQASLHNENESSNNLLKLQKKISSLENQLENKDQIIENLQTSLEKEKKKNESFNESLRKKEITLIQLTEETVKMSERLLGRSKQILDYSGHDSPDGNEKNKKNRIEFEDD